MTDDKDSAGEKEFLPEIRRAKFDKLTIYEVSEPELEVLEKGSPDSIYLNVAIALLSMAISLTATMLTVEKSQGAKQTFFMLLLIVGYIVGVILLVLWFRSRSSVSDCARRIRRRLPPEGKAEPL